MLTVLHSFRGGNEGSQPWAALLQAPDGLLYGTTLEGGEDDVGTVFSVTTAGNLTTLWEFTGGVDGAQPYGRLIRGADGAFYGTNSQGGADDAGTIFRITSAGAFTSLYEFTGDEDGGNPYSGITLGPDGALYGTTSMGGEGYAGSIFRITTSGSFSTLASFEIDYINGAHPGSSLLLASNGLFYSTTADGGFVYKEGRLASGFGAVFAVTLTGELSTVYALNGTTGSVGGLITASDGNFYGTTAGGGSNNDGTIFRITKEGALTELFSFSRTNGAAPLAGLRQGSDGAFYGTAAAGGSRAAGTIFKITAAGNLTTLHSFNILDGSNPLAPLLQAADGSFFGTTTYGGKFGSGSVFRLTESGQFTSIASFGFLDGFGPLGTLVQASSGELYGSTFSGGSEFQGTIFKVTQTGALTSLVTFKGANGAYPASGLIKGPDGSFYGSTLLGGKDDKGTLFRVTPEGHLTTLYEFTGRVDGGYPAAPLALGNNGVLVGTTVEGGRDGFGTAFEVDANGLLTILHSFSKQTEGGNPVAPLLVGNNGNYYGTTTYGLTFDSGGFFRIAVASENGSTPLFTAAGRAGNSLLLTWSAVAGRTYQLQTTSDLRIPAWSNLGLPIVAAGATAQTTAVLAPGAPRFYRLQVQP